MEAVIKELHSSIQQSLLAELQQMSVADLKKLSVFFSEEQEFINQKSVSKTA